MSIAALITQGIGPGSTIPYVLTGGLDLGAAPILVFDPEGMIIGADRKAIIVGADRITFISGQNRKTFIIGR